MNIVSYDFSDEDNTKTFTGEVDTEKYFKNVNEVKEYIISHNEKIKFWDDYEDELFLNIKNTGSVNHLIEEIEEAISKNENGKVAYPRFIAEQLQKFSETKKSIKRIIDNTPSYLTKTINEYKLLYEELIQLEKETKNKSWNFLKSNWKEIKEFLLSLAVDKAEQAKQRLKISQAKYYQKKKALLGIESKPKLTPEEKAERYKEQLKKANKTYYEKKRTELIELGVMKPKQTDEEKRLAKQEANKKYYASKKLKMEEAITEDY